MLEYALVTGASSGIGIEFARLFAGKGVNLILVARREEALVMLSEELTREFDIRVSIYSTDLSDVSNSNAVYLFCANNGLNVNT